MDDYGGGWGRLYDDLEAPPPLPMAPLPSLYAQTPQRRIDKLWFAFCVGGPETMGYGWKYLLNKFVSWRSDGMWHVEAVFRFDDGTLLAWHCTAEGPIQCMARDPQVHYRQSKWINFAADFTPSELDCVWAFLCDQNLKDYNFRGMLFNFLPVVRWLFGTREEDGRRWFCSELIAAALKRARPERFGDCRSSRMTIRELHDLMQRNDCFSPVISTMGDPSRMKLRFG